MTTDFNNIQIAKEPDDAPDPSFLEQKGMGFDRDYHAARSLHIIIGTARRGHASRQFVDLFNLSVYLRKRAENHSGAIVIALNSDQHR